MCLMIVIVFLHDASEGFVHTNIGNVQPKFPVMNPYNHNELFAALSVIEQKADVLSAAIHGKVQGTPIRICRGPLKLIIRVMMLLTVEAMSQEL